MLRTRTKQVNSYGRRASRIVNVSDRQDLESGNSSEAASDVDTSPLPRAPRRENDTAIARTKSRVASRRLGDPSRSSKSSPLAQNRHLHPNTARDAIAKQIRSKLESNTHIRQPLTPIRPNNTSSTKQPSSGAKARSKAPSAKRARARLKPHVPVVAVDIVVFDGDGNMVTQERRLSSPETQTSQLRTGTGKKMKISRTLPPSPLPIAISDSDSEVVSPEPVAKRLGRRLHTVIISSDESDASDKCTLSKKSLVPPANSRSRSKSLRAEVVIPLAPFRKSKISKRPPSLSRLALTPPRSPAQPTAPLQFSSATVPPLLVPPLLIGKPRQLTPIRGSSNRTLFRHPSPTPSTPTEADLSFDLAHLALSDATVIGDVASAQPEYLLPLLNECAQTCPYEFSAFIETFPFDPIVQSSAEGKDACFYKIGEASYSEVFGIGDVVLKIIPIRSEESTHVENAEIPAPSDAKDILKEIVVTREMGEICDKFVRLLKTYVVRGRYPSLFLDLWDEYNVRKGSESVRPDLFGLTQIYAIIILPNGGPDLESLTFKNVSKSGWHQACGIFWQVARALEQAEHLVNFEHRDLHWGQILVKNIPVKKLNGERPVPRAAMDDARFGVKVTIIDLGLSRMNAEDIQGSNIYWTPFDNEIFEGEGDYQYDVYRMMRDFTGSAWKSYHPFTNVMWLHYLVTKLLHEKRLKSLSIKKRVGGVCQVVSSTGYDEQECHDCLVEMEMLLGDCIASTRKESKSRRKTIAQSSGPRSARDVVAYGMRRGWV